MQDATIADNLRDVAAGLLTPFDETDTDEIRYEELATTANWLYDEGIRLFLACANISEYHSLNQEERIGSVRATCKALPEDATVLGGVGGSTKTAIELATAHEQNGADAHMIMPPDHAFKHESGVIEYYHRIADAAGVGIIPYVRGFDVTVRMMKRITAHENVAGVKWAISDIELFSECVAVAGDDVVWICGMAEPPAPTYYLEGAEGFSAGVTNFMPQLGLEIFDALESGDYERALKLRNLSYPLMNLRAGTGEENVYPDANSVPVVKRGLELAGQYGGPVREPLVKLPETDRDLVEASYRDLQAALEQNGLIEAR